MNNFKLTIQYDGTNYSGWQIQDNAETVQQKIVDSIKIILKEDVNLIGSGRTDAGVHALGQVANFQTEEELDIFKFRYSLNSILPADIAITGMEKVNEAFHSRFDAKKRSYIYLLGSDKSPFYYKYVYNYSRISGEQIEQLNKISKSLIGKFDFTSFARKQTETENKVCEIYDIHWRMSGDLTIFYVEADRFLHGMVRTMVGTLLYALKNQLNEKYLYDTLEKKDREAAAEAVPAKGLFLYKVRY